VIEYVENSLRQESEPTYKSRDELIKENEELRQQINELSRRCRLMLGMRFGSGFIILE